jgi:hypothetical protein
MERLRPLRHIKVIVAVVAGGLGALSALVGILIYVGVGPFGGNDSTGARTAQSSVPGRPLNVYAYCRYKGFATTRSEDEVRTVKDWQCVRSDGSAEPITSNGALSWDQACQFQYGPDVVAANTDAGGPPLRVRCVTG